MTVKHTLVSLDMRVFALCSLMELHRGQRRAGGERLVANGGNGIGDGDARQGFAP